MVLKGLGVLLGDVVVAGVGCQVFSGVPGFLLLLLLFSDLRLDRDVGVILRVVLLEVHEVRVHPRLGAAAAGEVLRG